MTDAAHIAVDLSSNNPDLDDAVYAAAGHRVVIEKATEGRTYLNPKYKPEEAHAAGLVVWHYHYLRGNGAAEAAWFLQNITPHLGPQDRIVVDFEEVDATSASCSAFQAAVEAAGLSAQKLVYGSPSTVKNRGLQPRTGWDLWEAQYNNSITWPDPVPGWPQAIAWQYTSTGQIEGVSDPTVDLSVLTDAAMPSGSAPPRVTPNVPAPAQVIVEGNQGPAVVEIQNLLNSRGFGPLVVDGSFGPLTTAAVKKAQAAYHIGVDGKVGPQTRGALQGGAAIPTGSTGKLTVDGNFGPQTITALQKKIGASPDGAFGPVSKLSLQKWLGVKADGNIGPVTITALQKRVGATPDGVWGKGTTSALQSYLNNH